MSHRIVVRRGDELLFRGWVIDADVLDAIVNPGARVLWSFEKKAGRVQPTAFTEDDCIWLSQKDVDVGVDA
jgi:hypothetical protein